MFLHIKISQNVEAIQKAIKDYEEQKDEDEQNEEKKRLFDNNEHLGMDEKSLQLHINATKIKNISKIIFGDQITSAWYYSPYPEPYSNVETLYICEYCLSYFSRISLYISKYKQIEKSK